MASIQEISNYIYRRALARGVNPNLALGIARYEGLNPRTIGSSTFGNPDAKGYSFGPFQLYSGSSNPNNIARGGMAYDFLKKYGERPSASNWQKQVDFSIDRMATSGISPWYAVRDQGGINAITNKGAKFARSIGLSADTPAVVPKSASTASAPTPPSAAAPAATPGALESIGSGLNYLARNGLGTIANTIAGREVVTPVEVPAAAAAAAKTPAQAGYGMASSLAGLMQLAAASEPKPTPMQPVYNKAARGGTNVNLAGIMGSPQDDELKRLMGLLGGGGGGYLE